MVVFWHQNNSIQYSYSTQRNFWQVSHLAKARLAVLTAVTLHHDESGNLNHELQISLVRPNVALSPIKQCLQKRQWTRAKELETLHNVRGLVDKAFLFTVGRYGRVRSVQWKRSTLGTPPTARELAHACANHHEYTNSNNVLKWSHSFSFEICNVTASQERSNQGLERGW